YAACIKKGNTALKKAIDDAIVALIADGTIKSIVDKYIK
ncbi:MAG: transporter substrate-binding domain-containing protein, partial [Clostridia bacterium]|nr:transporter substrate-binding domain-containing protein [Clostridia bacterium]